MILVKIFGIFWKNFENSSEFIPLENAQRLGAGRFSLIRALGLMSRASSLTRLTIEFNGREITSRLPTSPVKVLSNSREDLNAARELPTGFISEIF